VQRASGRGRVRRAAPGVHGGATGAMAGAAGREATGPSRLWPFSPGRAGCALLTRARTGLEALALVSL